MPLKSLLIKHIPHSERSVQLFFSSLAALKVYSIGHL